MESACRRDHAPALIVVCNGAAMMKLRLMEQACGCCTVRGGGSLLRPFLLPFPSPSRLLLPPFPSPSRPLLASPLLPIAFPRPFAAAVHAATHIITSSHHHSPRVKYELPSHMMALITLGSFAARAATPRLDRVCVISLVLSHHHSPRGKYGLPSHTMALITSDRSPAQLHLRATTKEMACTVDQTAVGSPLWFCRSYTEDSSHHHIATPPQSTRQT